MKSWALLSFAALALSPLPLLATGTGEPVVYVDECPGDPEAAGTASAWIVLDQDTGTLRHATRSELSSVGIDPLFNRSAEGLRLVVHADGSRSVNLEGRFQSVMIVRTEGDSTAVACTDDPDAAALLLRPEEK